MAGNLEKDVGARIAKAKNTCGIPNRRIFRNKVINPSIEIMLWNSLIRRTVIYGIRTKELPRKLVHRLETYMYNQIRTMTNPSWKDEACYPAKKQLYKKTNRSTMESWMGKTQIMTIPTQTQDARTIHPKQRKEMQNQRPELQAHWDIRNNAILEHAQQREMEKKGNTEYTKTAEKEEIAHLVARNPEIPNGLELNREGRKR